MADQLLAPYEPFDQGAPRINGSSLIGASPNKPILYALPVTGERPLSFSIAGTLPAGLTFDREQGRLGGAVAEEGDYPLDITVGNRLGTYRRRLTLRIAPDGAQLSPLMGWCSWNALGRFVTQQDICQAADDLVASGLSSFGYQYVNTDSAWQGEYGGELNAIQPNAKFPDMLAMTRHIHALGLKAGIYSTPMQLAWGGGLLHGCTRGKLDPRFATAHFGIGSTHMEAENARQWAAWEFDYLKYDWSPCDTENAERMKACLREAPRDIPMCVTVHAGVEDAEYWSRNCCSWRNNSDSRDTWENVRDWRFGGDVWAPYISAGHYYDLDMLETGVLRAHHTGEQFACRLTPQEQITAFSIRALLPSPLQIGCDLKQLSDFDRALLCNPEILAVNQDALGQAARCVEEVQRHDLHGNETYHTKLYCRPLENGDLAVGLFNLGEEEATVTLPAICQGRARDLWLRQELPADIRTFTLPPHAARMLRFAAERE